MKKITILFLTICCVFLSHVVMADLISGSLSQQKRESELKLTEEDFHIYLNAWETELRDRKFSDDRPLIIISRGCQARVLVENVETSGDLIIAAQGGGCYAFVRLRNVKARNIIILAEANGPVEINFLGKVQTEGKIDVQIGFHRGRKILQSKDLEMIENKLEEALDSLSETEDFALPYVRYRLESFYK